MNPRCTRGLATASAASALRRTLTAQGTLDAFCRQPAWFATACLRLGLSYSIGSQRLKPDHKETKDDQS